MKDVQAQLNKTKANSIAIERGQNIITNMRNLELDYSSRNRGGHGSTVMNNRTT